MECSLTLWYGKSKIMELCQFGELVRNTNKNDIFRNTAKFSAVAHTMMEFSLVVSLQNQPRTVCRQNGIFLVGEGIFQNTKGKGYYINNKTRWRKIYLTTSLSLSFREGNHNRTISCSSANQIIIQFLLSTVIAVIHIVIILF